MIGKRFHKWEVLNLIKINKPGKHYECMCDCGNIRIKSGTELRAAKGKQCQECQYRELYDTQREIGNKYGKWTVIKYIGMHRKLQQYETQCQCGNKGIHLAADLRAGRSTQCVRCHNQKIAKSNIKHGRHDSKLYKVWTSMLQRCTNPKCSTYKYYGARGISVCDKWNKFDEFYKDMGEAPEGMTLDRINNDGNYEKSNCRWVSHKENCNNRKKR